MTGVFRKMPSAKAYLQILGANTMDTTPSLLLFTDSQRYIFNCGEGTQRLFNEHKIKFSKINNIFLTQICWEYIGGLPGMAMTLRDNGRSSLAVYGPENLSEFIKATRFFLHQEKLHFDCVGFSRNEEERFEDENVTIWPVILTAGKSIEEVSHVTSQDESKGSDITEVDADSVDGVSHVRKKRKSNPGIQVSVSYICQLADLPGKFLPKKALELGVPRGPLFGELKQGEMVTLENGTEVKPEDVMEPKQPGPIFMIIDCPSIEHIPDLINNKRFLMFQPPQQEITVTLMIHVTPVDIFKTSAYQDWIESFGGEVQHLLFAKTQCNDPVFQRQHRIQCRLHTVDPQIFPLLYSSDRLDDEFKTVSKNVTVAENFNIFHLRPLKQQGFDNSDIPPKLNCVEIMKESRQLLCNMLESVDSTSSNKCSCSVCQEAFNSITKKNLMTDDVTDMIDSFSTERTTKSTQNEIAGSEETECRRTCTAGGCNANNKPCEENASRGNSNLDKELNSGTKNEITITSWSDDKDSVINAFQQTCPEPICSDLNFEVVFLGTGAALPSKYRNVSATLVSISNKSLLLDCGEGTYGQLYRHYGNQVDDVIKRLSCLFISHIHADHHLGLVQILNKRQLLLKGSDRSEEPLLVIGPKRIECWLSEYDSLCQSLDYSFIDSLLLTSQDHKWKDKFKLLLNAKELVTVPVDHCVQAYGLVWRHTSGYSIVYSGDTRPSDDLVQAGIGATVLIHEATFEDELKAEALDKKHSTTTEAINTGMQMKAKLIMLNHFSQRYPKIPVFNEQFTDCTGIAFDHMKISSNDFEKIPKLLEPLKVLFAEEMEELSSKTR